MRVGSLNENKWFISAVEKTNEEDLCTDSKIRKWNDMLSEFDSNKIDEMTIFSSQKVAKQVLNEFKKTNPEYFV